MRGDSEDGEEWQDWLVDETDNQETALVDKTERDHQAALLMQAMSVLNDREKSILQARRLNEPPLTLEELSVEFGISRERVRQIEQRSFEKIRDEIRRLALEETMPMPMNEPVTPIRLTE